MSVCGMRVTRSSAGSACARKHDRTVLDGAAGERGGAHEHARRGFDVADDLDVVPERQRLGEHRHEIAIGAALHDVLQHLVQRRQVVGARRRAREVALDGPGQPAADGAQLLVRDRRAGAGRGSRATASTPSGRPSMTSGVHRMSAPSSWSGCGVRLCRALADCGQQRAARAGPISSRSERPGWPGRGFGGQQGQRGVVEQLRLHAKRTTEFPQPVPRPAADEHGEGVRHRSRARRTHSGRS